MEQHLSGKYSVIDMINHIVALEEKLGVVSDRVVIDMVIANRLDAEGVLKQLKDNALKYSHVSISDYYAILGEPAKHQDFAKGWTAETIKKAYILPIPNGGYIIKFPPVEDLQ